MKQKVNKKKKNKTQNTNVRNHPAPTRGTGGPHTTALRREQRIFIYTLLILNKRGGGRKIVEKWEGLKHCTGKPGLVLKYRAQLAEAKLGHQ